jgi:hypothetical protein
MTDSVYEEEIRKRRARWAQALASGDYPQGKSKLLKNGKYCCLGVACEVFKTDLNIHSFPEKNRWTNYEESTAFEINGDKSTLTLPDVLRRYLGLSVGAQNVLITLNDAGMSFLTIASVITELAIVRE